jgi:hypothetical protein
MGKIKKMIEQRSKDSPLPKLPFHINTLKPPYIAVAPITPFIRYHHLANDSAVGFGKIIQAFCGIAQQRRHSQVNTVWVEFQLFSLICQPKVEFGYDGSISWLSWSDIDVDDTGYR